MPSYRPGDLTVQKGHVYKSTLCKRLGLQQKGNNHNMCIGSCAHS